MAQSILSRAALAAGLLASTSVAFNAASTQNVAIYWGQGNAQIPLSQVCSDPSVDIVNVAFVNGFPQTVGDYPKTNFANACYDYYPDPNNSTKDSGLLKTCPGVEDAINACQAAGKKVLLSLGGGYPIDYYIPSQAVAEYFAEFMQGAFGPVTDAWTAANKPRPFGSAVIDGYDFDLEADPASVPSPDLIYQNYDLFIAHAKVLRPTLLISGAPQCVVPDSHLAYAISKVPFDFLFIQFYNTDQCSAAQGYKELTSGGSQFTFDAWVSWVQANAANPSVKLFLGLPAGTAGVPSHPDHYLTPDQANALVTKYQQKYPAQFGGIMQWEATVASRNIIYGESYSYWMKAVVDGTFTSKYKPVSSSTTLSSSTRVSSTRVSSTQTSTRVSSTRSSSTRASSTMVSSTRASSSSIRASSTPVSSSRASSSPSSSTRASSTPVSSSRASSTPSSSTRASSTPVSSTRASSTPVSSTRASSTLSSSVRASSTPASSTRASSSPASSRPASSGASSSVRASSSSIAKVSSSLTGRGVAASSSAASYPVVSSSAYPTIVHVAATKGAPYPLYNMSRIATGTGYPVYNNYPNSYPQAAVSTPCSTADNVYPVQTKGYNNYPSNGQGQYPSNNQGYPSNNQGGYPSNEGYPANNNGQYPPSNNDAYPAVTEGPSYGYNAAPTMTTTIITTTYLDTCETGGLIYKTALITKTICLSCATPTPEPECPEGWTTSLYTDKTTTVTITKPIQYTTGVPSYPNTPSKPSYEKPVYSAQYPQDTPLPVYPVNPGKPTPTSTTVQVITLTKVAVPYTPVPYVPSPAPYQPAPYNPKNGTSPYAAVPTGAQGKPSSNYPVEFKGAANRVGAGMSTAIVVIFAGLFLL